MSIKFVTAPISKENIIDVILSLQENLFVSEQMHDRGRQNN